MSSHSPSKLWSPPIVTKAVPKSVTAQYPQNQYPPNGGESSRMNRDFSSSIERPIHVDINQRDIIKVSRSSQPTGEFQHGQERQSPELDPPARHSQPSP